MKKLNINILDETIFAKRLFEIHFKKNVKSIETWEEIFDYLEGKIDLNYETIVLREYLFENFYEDAFFKFMKKLKRENKSLIDLWLYCFCDWYEKNKQKIEKLNFDEIDLKSLGSRYSWVDTLKIYKICSFDRRDFIKDSTTMEVIDNFNDIAALALQDGNEDLNYADWFNMIKGIVDETKKNNYKYSKIISLSAESLEELFKKRKKWISKNEEYKNAKEEEECFTKNKTNSLSDLRKKLNSEVFNQEAAIEIVLNGLAKSLVGINNPEKPEGTYLFLGPTGTGKTELVKTLSKELGGRELIRFNMGDFTQKISCQRLLGVPAGYVGHESGGQLTNFVRKHPKAIILIDEVEKAHDDVLKIFLSILDEGVAYDADNKKCDFSKTIIVMTSNLGAKEILEHKEKINNFSDVDDLKNILDKWAPPELWNRLSGVLVFNPIDENTAMKIIDKHWERFNARLEKRTKTNRITLSNETKEKIYKNGFEKQYGARTIIRYIENNIESLVAYTLLDGVEIKDHEIIWEDGFVLK